MVLFMCTKIIIPDSKTNCLEAVIERENDDLLKKVPICLEISQDVPCCGKPSNGKQTVQTLCGRQESYPSWKVRERKRESETFCDFFKLQRTHHPLNIRSQDDEEANSLLSVQQGIIGAPYKEKCYIFCCILWSYEYFSWTILCSGNTSSKW